MCRRKEKATFRCSAHSQLLTILCDTINSRDFTILFLLASQLAPHEKVGNTSTVHYWLSRTLLSACNRDRVGKHLSKEWVIFLLQFTLTNTSKLQFMSEKNPKTLPRDAVDLANLFCLLACLLSGCRVRFDCSWPCANLGRLVGRRLLSAALVGTTCAYFHFQKDVTTPRD